MNCAVKVIQEITPVFKDGVLIFILCQLIVDVIKTDRLGIKLVLHPADTVPSHLMVWNRLLCSDPLISGTIRCFLSCPAASRSGNLLFLPDAAPAVLRQVCSFFFFAFFFASRTACFSALGPPALLPFFAFFLSAFSCSLCSFSSYFCALLRAFFSLRVSFRFGLRTPLWRSSASYPVTIGSSCSLPLTGFLFISGTGSSSSPSSSSSQ